MKYKKQLFICFAAASFVMLFMPSAVYASSDSALTNLFYTDAFHGDWEVFTKMNFLGKIMSFVISAFSLIGLFTVVLQLMLNLLYLSGKNFWDNVDEIKSDGKNNKAFGLGVGLQNAWNAKYGTGLDAIVSFLLSLLPNIREYSMYGSTAKHRGNLNENDTVTKFLLKTAIPNIMIIFAYSMGFNGTLFQAYGTVVNGMSKVSETFVETQLDEVVLNVLNSGSKYEFAYDTNTERGSFKQNVLQKVYTSVLKKAPDLTTDTKYAIGKSIDNVLPAKIDIASARVLYHSELDNLNGKDKIDDNQVIAENIDLSTVTASNDSVTDFLSANDKQFKNFEYEVTVNGTASYPDAISVPVSNLGLQVDGDKPYYVHIYISRKSNSNDHYYFTFDPSKKEEDGGASSQSPLNPNL